MQHLGETLRTARLQANLSLIDVELATKVRRQYIEAIENENFDALPGRVYAKGYLRTLAEYFGLDSNEILRLFEDASPPIKKFTVVPEVKYANPPSPITGGAVLSVIFVAVLAVVGYYVYQLHITFSASEVFPSSLASSDRKSQATSTTPTPRRAETTPTPVASPAPTSTPTPITEILVETRIVDRSWLQVTVDDKQVFQGILLAGEKRDWTAKNKIVIRSGNAGGVEITFNGRKQGVMGTRGEVLEKEWTIPVAGVGTSN